MRWAWSINISLMLADSYASRCVARCFGIASSISEGALDFSFPDDGGCLKSIRGEPCSITTSIAPDAKNYYTGQFDRRYTAAVRGGHWAMLRHSGRFIAV
jgi:hypothetical protein